MSEENMPGFLGGLMPIKSNYYWDQVHDDGIVYRHYIKDDKTMGEISSGMTRFELRKIYEDWIND